MKSPAKPLPTIEDTSFSTNPFVTESPADDEDTSVLLARMKQMVEGVKKRQSLGPRPSVGSGLAPTPRKPSGFSLLAHGADIAPVRTIIADSGDEDAEDISDKENNDGARPPTPDSDVEMVPTQVEPVQPARQPPNMTTPRMDDLRHLFKDPKPTTTPAFRGIREMFQRRAMEEAHTQTPKMDGVRQIFNHAERAPSTLKSIVTPTFDGVGDMFATSGTSHASEEAQPSEQHQVSEPEPEEVQEPEMDVPGPAPEPAVFARARKPAAMKTALAARRTSPRVATQEREDVEDGENSDSPAPPTTRVTRKPRSKAAPESDAEPEELPKTTRRTRKGVTPSPAPEEPKSATARPVRKTRGTTKTPTPEPPATRTSTARRTRTKAPLPEVEEEDPLDSIPRPLSPEVPLHEETGAKVRRSARSKITIKEEEEDASPGLPQPTTTEKRAAVPRTTRGRKPAGAAVASGIPRGGSRGGRIATTPRVTTATRSTKAAPDATTAVAGNKENTPEPDEEEQPEPVRPTAARSTGGKATKITRSAGRTRAASEQPEKPAAGSRVSRTRATKK